MDDLRASTQENRQGCRPGAVSSRSWPHAPPSGPAYAGVVEHSVYVHPAVRGRGVGLALLTALIATTEAAGIWSLRSGIFPENTASLALHQRAGFRIVGTRDRPGRLHGRWCDVVLVGRRSPIIT
jgi:L-amino acid N-acyltransferase YncA